MTVRLIGVLVAVAGLLSSAAGAQLAGREHAIPASALAGGGGSSRGGSVAVTATLGQAGPIGRAGAAVTVAAGLWPSAGTGGTAGACAGDCNGDDAVTIDELVRGVSLALGGGERDTCAALDGNGDSAVTIDELVAAVGNALAGCAPPPGPRVARVTPESAAAVVPFSLIRIVGTGFGGDDTLRRVTIGGREATVVEVPAADALLAIVPDLPAGAADLVVVAGDRATAPFRIAVAPAAPAGAPDTLDALLDSLDGELERFAGLDLETAYGANAAAVRAGIARFRQDLAEQRALLRARDPAVRARLDAIVDASGVAELVRDLLAGGAAAAPQGATTVLAAAQRLGQATRVVGAVAGAVGATLTIPELVLIGTGAAIIAGAVGLGAANVLAPVLLSMHFTGLLGEARQYPTVNGQVRVLGERLDALTTSLVLRTPRREWRQSGQGCGPGCLTFALPGDAGFCGGVILGLARGPLRAAQQIGTRVQPELIDLSPGEVDPLGQVTVGARGVSGCDDDALALYRPGTARGPLDTPLVERDGSLEMLALSIPPARYALSVSVLGLESSESLPLEIRPLSTDLSLGCLARELLVGETTNCFGSGNRGDVAYTELVWSSSAPDVVTFAPVPGLDNQITVVAVRPGTTTVSASARSRLDGHEFLHSSRGIELTVVDDGPPAVSVSPDPAGAPTTVAPGATFRVRVGAEDRGAVKTLRITASGDAVAAGAAQEELCVLLEETCTATFSVRVKEDGFTQREITIVASALDTADNVGHSSALTFTVDAPVPSPTPTATPTATPPPAGAWVLVDRIDPPLPTTSLDSRLMVTGNTLIHLFNSNNYPTPDWEFALSWDDPPEFLRADETAAVHVEGRLVRLGQGGARGVALYLFTTTCAACVDGQELRIGHGSGSYSASAERDLPLTVQFEFNTAKAEHRFSLYFRGGGLSGPVATYVYQKR